MELDFKKITKKVQKKSLAGASTEQKGKLYIRTTNEELVERIKIPENLESRTRSLVLVSLVL